MKVVIAYIAVIIIWGTTPLGIKLSLMGDDFLSPFVMRTMIGLVVTLLCLSFLTNKVRLEKKYLSLYLISALSLVGAMGITYWAAQYIPSGYISIIYGMAPIFTGIFSVFLLKNNWFSSRELLGISVAITGLIIIFYQDLMVGSESLKGIMGVFLAVVIYSYSAVIIKRDGQQLTPVEMNAGSLILATPILIIIWGLSGFDMPKEVAPLELSAVIYLGIFGSFLGFVLYFFVLQKMSAVNAMLIPLITPILAIAVGNVFNNEAITLNIVFGGILVLCGLIIYQFTLSQFSKMRLK